MALNSRKARCDLNLLCTIIISAEQCLDKEKVTIQMLGHTYVGHASYGKNYAYAVVKQVPS